MTTIKKLMNVRSHGEWKIVNGQSIDNQLIYECQFWEFSVRIVNDNFENLPINGDWCNIVLFTKSQLFNEVFMPNWTHNRIRVRGDNSEAIKEIRELFKG